MTYSSCLHNQQDLCWGNTSRDTSEESQESQYYANDLLDQLGIMYMASGLGNDESAKKKASVSEEQQHQDKVE